MDRRRHRLPSNKVRPSSPWPGIAQPRPPLFYVGLFGAPALPQTKASVTWKEGWDVPDSIRKKGIPELPLLPGGSSPALASHLPSPLPPKICLGMGVEGLGAASLGTKDSTFKNFAFQVL